MPIYEYWCAACGRDYEELVSMSEKENPPCPSCGSQEVVKKVSVFGASATGACGTSGFS